MVHPGAYPRQPDPYNLLEWVDAIADRFEAAWKSGQLPTIADYLGDTTGEKRSVLLRELVRIDWERRLKVGETRDWGDYLREFPELENLEPAETAVQVSSGATKPAPLDPEAASLGLPTSASAVPSAKWPVIEGYEILAELGHGGMGSVYKARQQSLNRIVALKLIRPVAQADPRYLSRFQTEAEATARLHHPNIAQIFEVGRQNGVPYLSMEYVDGGTLAQKLAGKPQPARKTAEVIAALARAMQNAHEHGVVHRDLKPDNILLEFSREPEAGTGDTLVSGSRLDAVVPKITDFGLAKLLGDGGGLSISGVIVGTPDYMAPEQAKGKAKEVGPPADIYSLGAILYEMLTGGPPFKGATVLDTLEQVRTGDLVPPSRLVPKVPRDLETICLKSLSRMPASRYLSAGAFADDLQRFLNGEPIQARPIGPVGRAWRWCRRHPTGAGLVATAAALLLTVVVASVLVAVASTAQERSQRREGVIQQLQLVQANDRFDGWSEEAWRLTTEAASLRKDAALRTLAITACAGLDARRGKHLERASVSWAAFDDTGRYLLLGGRSGAMGQPLEGAKLWDLETDHLEVSEEAGSGPVAFRRDGKPLHLVTRGRRCVLLWSLADQKSLGQVRLDPTPYRSGPSVFIRNELGVPVLALSRGGTFAAAATAGSEEQGVITVWDAESGRVFFQVPRRAVALAFAPAGDLLAVGDAQGEITLWTVPEGKEVTAFRTGRVTVHGLSFSPDSKRLAVGDSGRQITLWDIRTRLPVTYCQGSSRDVYALAFNPEGTLLASGGRGPAHLWDAASGRLLLRLRSEGLTTALVFAPDGRRLVVGSKAPARVSVWNLDPGRGIQMLRGLTSPASRIGFSADGRSVAALAPNGQLAIWDLRRDQLRLVLPGPRGAAEEAALAFSPDGYWLACAGVERAKLWNLITAEKRSWPLPRGVKNVLAFHPSGALLLFRQEQDYSTDRTRSADSQVPKSGQPVCRIRNLLGSAPMEPFATLADFDGVFLGAAAAPDGSTFFAEGTHRGPDGQRRSIKAYDSLTGAERWSIPSTRSHLAASLVLDPTGRLLAFQTDNRDNQGSVAEASTGKVLGGLEPFPVCLGPDAKELVQVGTGDVRKEERGYALFRRGDSSLRLTLGIESTPSFIPVFSRDGGLLAWPNADSTVSICDLESIRWRMSTVGLEW
jgi:serine/threonine protein kinase/WD40 repeat protein